MKKIVIIATGSIALRRGPHPSSGAWFAPHPGDDALAQIPRGDVELVLAEFSNLPASHITPSQSLELARRVDEALRAEDVAGVVVTHGVDTIEETAYLLDLTVAAPKPVVLTGAVRQPSGPSYDGASNMAAAVRVAAAPEAHGMGALVVFAERIYAAEGLCQVHPQALDPFATAFGPLGRVEGGRIWIERRPARRSHIPCAHLEERVDLITIGQGADDRLLRHAIADSVAGVVIEAFGGGRVPPWWLPSIREAVSRRMVVVVAPRAGVGALHDEHGYVGAYHDLQRLGVLFAHHLSGPQARIRLMVALGAARRPEEARAWFPA